MDIFLLFLLAIVQNFGGLSQSSCVVPSYNGLPLPIAIISDLDTKTRSTNNWYSTLKYGTLSFSLNNVSISWTGALNITSTFNFNQKSMEMSDLKIFNGRLLSVDDKMGIVNWVRNGTVIPWVIATTGDGTTDKPFKGEWLAIKDNELYMGSSGHEKVQDGVPPNEDWMYIRVITADGGMRVENWRSKYLKLREAVGISFPGYIIHEAVQYSEIHRKWFFLPRYVSKIGFTFDTTYKMGSNILLTTDDSFNNINVVNIGKINQYQGYSAFQFVPGTNDRVIIALKTSEVPVDPSKPDDEKIFSTWITVFDIEGRILLEDEKLDEGYKYEGIEFANVNTCL